MTFNEFMNKAWTATEVVGYGKVAERVLGYGSRPDITLFIEGSDSLLSAKKLFELGVEVR